MCQSQAGGEPEEIKQEISSTGHDPLDQLKH